MVVAIFAQQCLSGFREELSSLHLKFCNSSYFYLLHKTYSCVSSIEQLDLHVMQISPSQPTTSPAKHCVVSDDPGIFVIREGIPLPWISRQLVMPIDRSYDVGCCHSDLYVTAGMCNARFSDWNNQSDHSGPASMRVE